MDISIHVKILCNMDQAKSIERNSSPNEEQRHAQRLQDLKERKARQEARLAPLMSATDSHLYLSSSNLLFATII
jgi:hypothetical protein